MTPTEALHEASRKIGTLETWADDLRAALPDDAAIVTVDSLAAALAKPLEREVGDALEASGVHISKGIQRNREPDPLRVLLAAVPMERLAAAIIEALKS